MKKPHLTFILMIMCCVYCINNSSAQTSFISTPVTTAIAGEEYIYTVQATGTPAVMEYSLVSAPENMTINSTTGRISWTPASNNLNSYVQVRAYNGTEAAAFQSFWIFIAAAPQCESGILALYRLDETSGPNYADAKGNHNVSTTAAPEAGTGKLDGGQVFDNSTLFDISDNGTEWDWVTGSSFSIECWVKTSVDDRLQVFVSRYDSDPALEEITTAWWLGQNTLGNAALEIKDKTNHNSVLFSDTKIADNQWHHIVGVRNGATQHNKIYVDGVECADMEAELPGGFTSDTPTPVTLGYMKRPYDYREPYHLNGTLDEVVIYTRALSAQEISDLYNEGNPEGHCGPGNYAPVITSTPSTTGFTEVQYTYNFTVEEKDIDDIIVLSAVSKPAWLNFTFIPGQKSALLSGIPGSSNVGENNITLSVYDGQMTREQSFTIDIQNSNHLPLVTSTPSTVATEDVIYSYTLSITDTDLSDVIKIEALEKPEWLTFDWVTGAKTAILSGTPENGIQGLFPIVIRINDGNDTILHTYNLTVNAVNDPPVITSEAETEAYVGVNYIYIFSASDIDNNVITLSVVQKPEWLSFTTSGILSGQPTIEDVGTQLIILRASDGLHNTDEYLVLSISEPTGTSDLEDRKISISPIPAKEFITVELGKAEEETIIELFNSAGIKILSEIIPANQQYFQLNLANVDNGIYFIHFRNHNLNKTSRILIAK